MSCAVLAAQLLINYVSAAVIVATVRAIKYHGGVDVADLGRENLVALQKAANAVQMSVVR